VQLQGNSLIAAIYHSLFTPGFFSDRILKMSAAEQYIRTIREQGYVLIKAGNSAAAVARLLEKIKEIAATTESPGGSGVPYLNRGHHMLYNMQNKEFLFVEAKLRHVLVTEILMALLNDEWYKQIPPGNPSYILRSMLARSGGESPLPLHIDSFIPSSGSYCWSAQASFILEDQTAENGCTIAVPGSHLFDRYASPDDMGKAVKIESQAGDILVWDSRLWHGTSGNKSGKTRWAFISTFTRWWLKQNYQITETFPVDFYRRLSDAEKAVIGYCSIPSRDEYDRIDIKGGYEILPQR